MVTTKIFVALLGACFGSLLNCLNYRLPRNIDPFLKRSHCVTCKRQITWYENIPVISWLILKGKCRTCQTKIGIEYPMVELLLGFFAVYRFPMVLTTETLAIYLFEFFVFFVFVGHFIIDLKHQILPDSFNILLAILFLVRGLYEYEWIQVVYGGALGFFFPLLITWVFYLIKGQIGLGGGDIKLWGALGLYLGVQGVMHNVFLSCFLGSIVGGGLLISKKITRNTPVPFGPFILIVAFIQIFYPQVFQKLFQRILVG